MESEKLTGKKREGISRGLPTKEPTANPKGTLRVHVVDKSGDAIQHARITVQPDQALGPSGGAASGSPILGETNEAGDFVESVAAGIWKVTAEAFGESSFLTNVGVVPRLETVVNIELPFDLSIPPIDVRWGAGHENAPLSPGHSIIVAKAQFGLLSPDNLVFEWNISDGSILETGRAAEGAEIHIDTSGVRGSIDIEVRMSELSTSKGEK